MTERGRYKKTIAHAEQIWDLLASAEQGMSTRELTKQTGLSADQVRNGLTYLKEVLQGHRIQPLAYDPRAQRYLLTQMEREETEYIHWSLRRLATALEHLQPNLAAADEKWEYNRHFRRLRRNIDRLADDVTDVLQDVEPLLDEVIA